MVDAACKSVVEEASASSATLPVGFFVAAACEVLTRLASRVRHGWPDIELRIPSMTHAEHAAAMARGAMDLGIAWLPLEHRGYEPIPLASDRFRIALPTAYRLARQHVIPRDDLLGERLRPGCRNAGIARAISRLFSGEDPDRHKLLETRVHDLRAAIDSFGAGSGNIFAPGAMRGEQSGHVIPRHFDSAEPLPLGAVCPGGARSIALHRFGQCISAVTAEQAGQQDTTLPSGAGLAARPPMRRPAGGAIGRARLSCGPCWTRFEP